MKHFMLAIGLILGGAALSVGCGDSGGGNKQLCIDTCEKQNECFDMSNDCEGICDAASSGGTTCKNAGEIKSATRNCNEMSCDDYAMCTMDIPACEE